MIRIFRDALIGIAAICWTTVALAQTLTAEDQRDLAAVVEQFLADTRALNVSGVVETMPPSVIADLAHRNDMTETELISAVVEAMEAAMESVALLEVQMDSTAAVLGETSAGRIFVLLPTMTLMQVGDAVYRAGSHTLAFKETGQWSLIRLDEPSQRQMLVNALPEFTGITFPEASLEQIE
ncbi:MAG: hypothetical protein R8G34_07140 [Paracoccaceae bacterium]|nr:hypothetical protein [Paracoccaceae bacterium]